MSRVKRDRFKIWLQMIFCKDKQKKEKLKTWLYYHKFNKPMMFKCVAHGIGESVGHPVSVYHLTFHDMFDHMIRACLTNKVLLEDMDINAYQELSFERLDAYNGKVLIQPVKIKEIIEQSLWN